MLQGDFNFDNAGQMDGGEGADDNDEDKGGYLTVDPNEENVSNEPAHKYGQVGDSSAHQLDPAEDDNMALYDMPDGPMRPESPDE